MNKIKLVTASAGSGKTHKLQETLATFVDPKNPQKIRPEGVIATTFTKKAAAELKERAREALIKKGFFDEAVRLEGALINTVHSVCTKIIEMFCYDSGMSPRVEVLPEDDQDLYFSLAMSSIVTPELGNKMYDLSCRLFDTNEIKWVDEVRNVISQARANGIGPEGLKESFAYSWKSFEACLPSKMEDAKPYEDKLISEGKRILKEFEALPRMTNKDAEFCEMLKPFLGKLESGYLIRWDDWQALVRDLDANGRRIATSYQGLIGDYLKHPKLHEDYRTFIEEVFSTAARALDAYRNYKRERGLVDFVDMECMVSDLLDDPKVQARIKEDFDLLMVDEFQDTNPIQLGIFLKLSKIIPHVIWVGDQKQSIYGFRGADPSLMTALLEKMKPGLDIETLDKSYRSREDLVQHTNALFTKSFAGLLPEDQIRLDSTRKDKPGHESAIEVWRVEKAGSRNSKERTLRAVAKEIKALVESKRIIAQKNRPEEIIREVAYKDIACLFKFNDDCNEMATYLTELGVPVSLKQPGLLSLPESKLMMAALRYYCFPSDSLAVMEMKLLISGEDNVEKLIEERIKIVSEKAYADYGKDCWAVSRIDELRNLALNLSPAEVVTHILMKLELQRIVESWEGDRNRWNNLVLFKESAQKFEESCQRLKMGATLGGFLLWLQQRDEAGMLCFGGDEENAVTVMTWHKSKGLEWPVVVLADTQKKIKRSPFGLKVVSPDGDLDLDNPLKGRVLRYWVSFISSRRTKAQLLTLIGNSEIARENSEVCLKEGKRLLYVGVTRARDYLIFPLAASEEACHISEALDDENADLPKEPGLQVLDWAGECKPVLVKKLIEVSEVPKRVETISERDVLKAAKGPEVFQPYLINPSQQLPVEGAQAILFGTYGSRLSVKAPVDDDKLGDCLHDIAALTKLAKNDVERVLENYGLKTVLEADEILKQMELFDAFLAQKGFKNPQREVPVLGKINGQLVNGVIDLMMDHNSGQAIIDHKSFQGTKLEDKAISFSGQMKVYKTFSSGEVKLYINFLTLGCIYEVIID